MKSATKDACFVITLLLLVFSVALSVFGIAFVSTSCNSKYRDCVENMQEVKLVDISSFNCGYECEHPKYDFSFVGQPGMCSVIDESKTNYNVTSDTQIYNYNQSYHVYTYSGYGMSLCDMNSDRENYMSNIGIITLCVSLCVLISTMIYQIWYCVNQC